MYVYTHLLSLSPMAKNGNAVGPVYVSTCVVDSMIGANVVCSSSTYYVVVCTTCFSCLPGTAKLNFGAGAGPEFFQLGIPRERKKIPETWNVSNPLLEENVLPEF